MSCYTLLSGFPVSPLMATVSLSITIRSHETPFIRSHELENLTLEIQRLIDKSASDCLNLNEFLRRSLNIAKITTKKRHFT
ncbi:unnamed protein product [Onchocerca flexuosa]|uniref:Uncharacterized protein n=1 Tax=Onchocerca flexuosa TaxID=387005 RepID=A0A183I8N9_9BILA|nr:unnamed protein product [Onchocerca flexuosa]